MYPFRINGKTHQVDVADEVPLLWLLRDSLGLKGTKYGCGVGICGICTVLADGSPIRSCVVPASEAAGRDILTIEGMAETGHRLLTAWLREQVPQCGYCQPGQIMAAAGLLAECPDPGEADIDAAMGGILCRCGTYQRIRQAIHTAVRLPEASVQPLAPLPAPPEEGVALDDWIRIAPDGSVTVMINHAEMGQGVSAALAALVAEELEVDMAEVSIRFAPAQARYRNPMFNSQTTGGSTSIRGEWERLSLAGAKARERLITAAAEYWNVDAFTCVADAGEVIHSPTGRRLNYGEIAADAARVRPPHQVMLKPPDQCRLLGRPWPRVDLADMVAGRTVYGMDVSLPGCRVACIARCPVSGGRVVSYDPAPALSVPGVEQVTEVASGVAVVAGDTWAAFKGRDALEVEWDPGPDSGLDSDRIMNELDTALDRPGERRQQEGEVDSVLRDAETLVEACYATAPLAHATLEPMNCIARITETGCDVWVGTQSQEDTRETAARVSGQPKERVRVHSQYLGGGFGRRLETDMVTEAVELAGKLGGPVQVVWNRDDDMRHDFYRPAYRARLRAVMDAGGWPLAWHQRGAGPDLAGMAHAGLVYAIPHIQVEFTEVESALPVGSWRSVGAGQDAFAVESFIDELAHVGGHDPYRYRRELLRHSPRHRGVLDLAARAANWDTPLPGGHRGIAVYRSFGSYVAEVAEVSVSETGIVVHRVVCAIDCGRTVNPDLIRAQLEGAVANGVSVALKEAISLEQGRVKQATFEDYPILTLPEMPRVEVYIVESDAAPGGVGEPGLPPVAPAVANALAAATGQRLRSLPLCIT